MTIRPVPSRESLDRFAAAVDHAPFLQSWAWGEFQAARGLRVVRYAWDEDGATVAAGTVTEQPLPFGARYLNCPRGPVIAADRSGLWSAIRRDIRERHPEAVFLRCEPAGSPPNRRDCRRTIDQQPSRTAVVDLSGEPDAMLTRMHPKTRYNIRLAERHGVTVRAGTAADFDAWWPLLAATRDRDRFRTHPAKHYRAMLQVPGVSLLLAERDGRLLAGNLLAAYGDTVSYLHGASGDGDRQHMAPYLLQWRGMLAAREQGKRFYDLFGIDPARWPGVTRFKRGFGGVELIYPGTFDIILRPAAYRAYTIARWSRRLAGRWGV